jgi:hypothetical protein
VSEVFYEVRRGDAGGELLDVIDVSTDPLYSEAYEDKAHGFAANIFAQQRHGRATVERVTGRLGASGIFSIGSRGAGLDHNGSYNIHVRKAP